MFARTVMVLMRRDDEAAGLPAFDMIVRRSYAAHVWRWLAMHATVATRS
jgi:sarcosine oxidase gamma subunit